MNRRRFLRNVLGGGASLLVPAGLGLVAAPPLRSYFFAPSGGWPTLPPDGEWSASSLLRIELDPGVIAILKPFTVNYKFGSN